MTKYPNYIPDNDDMKLFLKECMLAGKEITVLWHTNEVDPDGRKGSHRSIDDDPSAVHHTGTVGVWRDDWMFGDEDPYDALYRYKEVNGKKGWWISWPEDEPSPTR